MHAGGVRSLCLNLNCITALYLGAFCLPSVKIFLLYETSLIIRLSDYLPWRIITNIRDNGSIRGRVTVTVTRTTSSLGAAESL